MTGANYIQAKLQKKSVSSFQCPHLPDLQGSEMAEQNSGKQLAEISPYSRLKRPDALQGALREIHSQQKNNLPTLTWLFLEAT